MNIVFCDVDGTFQEIGLSVPKVNIDAVNDLQEQGDRFVFVSGRNYDQMQLVLSDSALDCDIIFSNGAGYRLKGEQPNYMHTLSLQQLEYIVKIVDENDCFYHIHTSEKIYLKPMYHFSKHIKQLREDLVYMGEQGKKMMDFKEQYFTKECEHIEDVIGYFKEHPEIKPLKVELMDGDDNKRNRLQKIFQEAGFSAFSSFITALEVIDRKSNKGAAIKRYLHMFDNVTSYGIGDGENDISMFDATDISVAVGNASKVIKEKCDLVVKDCNDGGVGHFLFDTLIQK